MAFAISGHEELRLPDGLRLAVTGDPTSPVLGQFFQGYDRAFILPDEREELDGFRACLGLNASHRHALGRTHCEVVALLQDDAGHRLGGINFLAVDHGAGRSVRTTLALNYLYVEEAARGRGLLRKMLAATRQLGLVVLELEPDQPAPVIFIEQNDPLRLTEQEYHADTRHAGLDQVDRLAIWARMGAKVVDFDYVQPALSEDLSPDDSLIYAALDYPEAAIEARVLHDHLESFFAISVLKGRPGPARGVAERQLTALALRRQPVALLPMGEALTALRAQPARWGADSFRELAKRVGQDDASGQ
ncbi:hypothetical protein [Brevundimonas vesicularis]|uniref:hypothetical protein n=1 Tax=Brevundimonas vesicularis TaxID=41276 RepID=UPI0038D366CE